MRDCKPKNFGIEPDWEPGLGPSVDSGLVLDFRPAEISYFKLGEYKVGPDKVGVQKYVVVL